ncbi:ABC transporter ATP-binding protein [Methylomarinum sp. Ch1-1]|uniref:ABC transporter ATP-binding protein n=1 Tax=Methylomarinum roseum TaxID=3067653 RepID=A0AAU7NTN4_9GAMM|nr:ABC transporter ATP-binding protein [Methylomarinum sp. Ch1-1]MDP4519581.1 ABC transporter ATP-binding protein [Methylomarinum sp. Ch1-1]
MTALIEAKNLYRYYDDHCAVHDVSFNLNKGEILGFLGPNGAGKTTTMQMLCGNLAPSAGQIIINGIDLLDKPKLAKSILGYLPDTPPLYKELSVDEYLDYCARLHRLPFRAIAKAVAKAKGRCGLEAVSDRLISNLSKGFQQRIGIAQAIVHEPELIILDEPTVGLDPIQIKEIRALIKELGSDHGVILSTHILSEVQESCSHVQIINRGKLILHETIAGLNRQMNGASIKFTTREPIDTARLSSLEGVTNITMIAKNQYLLQHANEPQLLEKVALQIIEAGWGLGEIAPVRQSIEDIFISMTQKDEDAR